ncbi:phosphotyrosine protein phosphatase [Streptomyces sp. NPDC048496]|uniref:phosphotyrosine protein phosphatase n=1 Tax=Streptomyces sp. NPDC048496 TaxID=3365558 RepID=UPI0037119845
MPLECQWTSTSRTASSGHSDSSEPAPPGKRYVHQRHKDRHLDERAEVGIDISAEIPKVLTVDAVKESDVCITMGCGDTCPVFPGKRYLDWKLEDPAGRGVEAVRPIRDEIRALVEGLIAEIAPRDRAPLSSDAPR